MEVKKNLVGMLIVTSFIAMVLAGGSALIILPFALLIYDDHFFVIVFSIAMITSMMFVISLLVFINGRMLLKIKTVDKKMVSQLCLTSFFAMVFVGGLILYWLLFHTHNFDYRADYENLALGLTIMGGIGYVISLAVFNITLKKLKTENETKEDHGPVKIKSRMVQASEYAAKNELSVDAVISMIHNEELEGEKKWNTWYVVPKT